MEKFDENYKGNEKSRVLETDEEYEEFYQPLLDKRQIMPIVIGNTKVLHIDAELDPLKPKNIKKKQTVPKLNI